MDLVTSIIYLLAGVSLFLLSLKMMAKGLRNAAGKGIRNLFQKTKESRFINFGIGAAATGVIQSSDATSVMVIGFISAGVLSIFQGVCLILGAYVGTTVTGIIVAVSSFKLSDYLILFAIVGTVLSFFQKEFVKYLGMFLSGFGLLFFALATMKGVFVPGSEILSVCSTGVSAVEGLAISPLLFFLIGIAFTLITQSSSATSGIVIVLVGSGVIGLSSGFYLVLGATVGSVVPTLLAAIDGNVDCKRTGFICVLVKSIPAVIALILVWIFESNVSWVFSTLFKNNNQFAVAMFMFTYSLIAMLIQLFFANNYIDFATKVIKDKETEKKRKAIKFIDNRLLNAPKVAMSQVKKEIGNMLSLSRDNFILGYNEVFSQDQKNNDKMEEIEESLDFINSEIASFLIALSPNVGSKDERKIGGYFHMINDIERIGDHAYNFHDMCVKMSDENLKFSITAQKEMEEMYTTIMKMYDVAFDIFQNKENISELKNLHELETKTDKLKLKLSAAHFARVTDKTCSIELSSYYSTLVSELERVADHLVNIGYAFVNPTGDEEEK